MGHSRVLHAYFLVLSIIICVSITLGSSRPRDNTTFSSLPYQTSNSKLCTNTTCLNTTSSDYGKIVHELPLGVLYPSSISDITHLVKLSYNSFSPFTITARGNGHSVRGQSTAKDGVVVEMASLNSGRGVDEYFGIRVSGNSSLGFYADVGSEQLWIDVLQTTLKYGLAPVSWTDYLYLTVGGTLSNAGISGQSSFYGPQISNVLEIDVITGKGNFITCSKHMNSDLFFAVLGGLGQFGIITRARIVLHKAPYRVKRVRIIYEDFSKYSKDQEYLISVNGLDYLEGSLMMDTSPTNNFYSPSDASKINSLASKNAILYTLEAVKYYHDHNINTVDEELEMMFKGLSFTSGFIFKKDSSFFDFVNRLGNGEKERLEDTRHPWLNLFVPRSRIIEFNQGVFVEILQKQGPYLVYPINRKKWDDRMSVVIPDDDEDMFYTVGLLHSAKNDHELTIIEEKNKKILEFCYRNEINIKQYFPHYKKKEEWMKHFGKKWDVFQEKKDQFDPKKILSPGQRIYNSD